MDTKLMNTPVTNFEALVGQARDCGLTQTFATAYEVNKALDEADCCGGSGQKTIFKIKDGTSLRTNETEFPFDIDSTEVTNFSSMFWGCNNLTEIPPLDTSNGTNFLQMFYGCSNLTSIPQLDTSKGTNFGYMFQNCTTLENITFIGSINANIDFNACTSLSYESVKSILTACSNTTNTNSKTVYFNSTITDQNGELLALVESCTSKGWTISGLTLN